MGKRKKERGKDMIREKYGDSARRNDAIHVLVD